MCRRILARESAAWQATGGRNHFFIVTSDFGPCDHSGHLITPWLLAHHMIATHGETVGHHWHHGVGPPLPCFDSRKDISIAPSNWLHAPRDMGGSAGKRESSSSSSSSTHEVEDGDHGNVRREGQDSASGTPPSILHKDLLAFFAGAGESVSYTHLTLPTTPYV